MSKAKEIRSLIRDIAGKSDKGRLFFNAKVLSVNGDKCDVLYFDLTLTDVRLASVVDTNPNKLIIKPKVDSIVLIADLSMGELRDLIVIGWSEVDSILFGTQTDGGVVKITPLISDLNIIKTRINDVVTALNTISSVLAPVSAPVTGTAVASAISGAITAILSPLQESNKNVLEGDKIIL
jgi:hypothetical protein